MKNTIAKEFKIHSHCMVYIPENLREYGEVNGTLPMYINLNDGYHLMLLAESGYRYAQGENKGNSCLLDNYLLCAKAVDFVRENKEALFSRQVSLGWFGNKLDNIFEKITDCFFEISLCLLSEEHHRCYYYLSDDFLYGSLLCIAKKDTMDVITINNNNMENERASTSGFAALDDSLDNYRLWLINDTLYNIIRSDSEIYSRPIEMVYEQPLLSDFTNEDPDTELSSLAYVTVDIVPESLFPDDGNELFYDYKE